MWQRRVSWLGVHFVTKSIMSTNKSPLPIQIGREVDKIYLHIMTQYGEPRKAYQINLLPNDLGNIFWNGPEKSLLKWSGENCSFEKYFFDPIEKLHSESFVKLLTLLILDNFEGIIVQNFWITFKSVPIILSTLSMFRDLYLNKNLIDFNIFRLDGKPWFSPFLSLRILKSIEFSLKIRDASQYPYASWYLMLYNTWNITTVDPIKSDSLGRGVLYQIWEVISYDRNI